MNEHELDWGGTIQKESEFVLLPAGDYDFTVTGFERARHAGSAKLPPCNKAVIDLTMHTQEYGDIVVKHNLFLHTVTEGMLSAFFGGIGQKKKGEMLTMNWNAVQGATGRCRLKIKTWNSNSTGEELQGNEVQKFYYKEPVVQNNPHGQTYQQQQPGYQQQQQVVNPGQTTQQQQQQQNTPFPAANNTGQQQQGNFTPGAF